MIGRYRNAIVALTRELRTLEESPGDLDALLSIQMQLIKKISATEKRQSQLKENLKVAKKQLRSERLDKVGAASLKKRIKKIMRDIEDYDYLHFIWRAFGDAIAFMYVDKFSLKHVYYNTTDTNPKQEPGRLSGKDGLDAELQFLKMALARGIPSVLSDLTNTIRHGDVCLLGGTDPVPIEVKTSSNRNPRVDRQEASLGLLAGFFENDHAKNFRGMAEVKRVEFGPEEVTHVSALNKCIEIARHGKGHVICPETGLKYGCLVHPNEISLLDIDRSDGDWVLVSLNQAKSSKQWMPYYPFTLSIRDPDDLFRFVNGEFVLVVALSAQELIERFLKVGVLAVMPGSSDDWVLWLRSKGGQADHAVSGHLFSRIFFEFQSLSWFVESQVVMQDRIEKQAKAEFKMPPADSAAGLTARVVPLEVENAFRELESKS